MKVGVFLPISGRAASGVLLEAAQRAEALGFDSVWAADRIVTPWRIDTPYAYNEDRRFFVPPDAPFLEPLTCLAYLAGGTSRITLGMSVLVLPYRHPLHWAKVATTLDHLSRGRFVLGVGVGWMVEEFAALGRADVFAQRGAVSDEQLRLVETLWTEPRPRFEGRFYRFDEVGFEPKPLQRPRVPIWVGGEGRAARRRAGRHGDAWFPYFVRITPAALAEHFVEVRRFAAEAGRDPAEVRLCCCLPIEITETPAPQAPDRVAGTPEQVAATLAAFAAAGVEHLALQFMAPRWPLRALQIERFAAEALPRLR